MALGFLTVRDKPWPSVVLNQLVVIREALDDLCPTASTNSTCSPPLSRLPAYSPTTGSLEPYLASKGGDILDHQAIAARRQLKAGEGVVDPLGEPDQVEIDALAGRYWSAR